jgi:MoxR-like ATPase
MLGAKARAAAAGRSEVSADDLAAVAAPALRHRIILNFEGQAENIRTETLVESILQSVKA